MSAAHLRARLPPRDRQHARRLRRGAARRARAAAAGDDGRPESTPSPRPAASGRVETMRRAFARRVGVPPVALSHAASRPDPPGRTPWRSRSRSTTASPPSTPIGPYEVLSRLPGAQVTWLAHEPGLVRTDNHMLALEATATFEDLPRARRRSSSRAASARATCSSDERILDWLRGAHATSTWTTSVCTGSLLLGAAGILDGPARDVALARARDARAATAPTPTGERVVAARARSSPRPASRPASTWRCWLAGADRRRRVRAGRPADDRVRPRAAVRRGLDREGRPGADGEAARGRRRVPLTWPVARRGAAIAGAGRRGRAARRRRSTRTRTGSPRRSAPPCRAPTQHRALLVELPPARPTAAAPAGSPRTRPAVLRSPNATNAPPPIMPGDLAVELGCPPALARTACARAGSSARRRRRRARSPSPRARGRCIHTPRSSRSAGARRAPRRRRPPTAARDGRSGPGSGGSAT